MPEQKRPIPGPDELTLPFWDAAREGRLAIQQCHDCSYYNHPPRRECDRCLSNSLEYKPVSGKGTVYSYTVMYQPSIPGFAESLPYVTALVELDEQPMLLVYSNVPGAGPSEVSIGQR